MATVLSIIKNSLMEIGALGQGETPSASDAQTALSFFQDQIDAWAADRLTLSVQSELSITWPPATSTQTIGPSGANITAQRPVWINAMNYVVPGSSPAVESPMGALDLDSYANLSIKGLQSALPTQFFYQTSIGQTYGTIFVWPQPTGSITLKLYAPQAVTVPVALTDILLGPPGYQEAFRTQLSLRLLSPFSRSPNDVPLLVGPEGLAAQSYARMKRPNNMPGLLGVDAALVGTGSGYNILSDRMSSPSSR